MRLRCANEIYITYLCASRAERGNNKCQLPVTFIIIEILIGNSGVIITHTLQKLYIYIDKKYIQ